MPGGSPLEEGRIEQILWLTDLSATAAACSGTVRWLATLAQRAGEEPASVRVVHLLATAEPSLRAKALAACSALAGDLGSIGLDAEPAVFESSDTESLADGVRALCAAEAVDLCVLGRHPEGRGRLARALGAQGGPALLLVQEPSRLPPWAVGCAAPRQDAGAWRIAQALAGAGGAREVDREATPGARPDLRVQPWDALAGDRLVGGNLLLVGGR